MQKTSIKSFIIAHSKTCDQLDIELIISHVLKKERVFIITHDTLLLTKNQEETIKKLCKKRTNGYPLAYILGEKEFYGRDFKVNEDTLVPRAETEILIDIVLSFINKKDFSEVLILDIGTGSGIIPITLQKEIPNNITKTILASDISQKALKIAKENADNYNASEITFFDSDLLDNSNLLDILKKTNCKNLIITANLPYVNKKIKPDLLKKEESKSLIHEPQIALWSKDDGLAHYKKLLRQTASLLNELPDEKTISSFYEISPEQSQLLTSHIKTVFPNAEITISKDLAQKDRVLHLNTNHQT
ncbi:MAG: peptide chain release factor N(5)-glutamine methyltransferase [Patescibacteria group bacterium]